MIVSVAAIIGVLVVLVNVATRLIKAMICLLEAKHLLMLALEKNPRKMSKQKATSNFGEC